jgi:hypothetical protein
MRTVVITRYNESLSWINSIKDNVVIYNKGHDELSFDYISRPNIGREAESMLYFIIENYNLLTKETVFLQGNPFDHCSDLFYQLEENKNVNDIVWLGTNWGPVFKNYDGGPGHWCYLPLLEISNLLFDNCKFDTNSRFVFSAGAQYIVPMYKIKSKSLNWWKNCYSVFNQYIETSPWAFERLWPLIWNYSTNH